MGRLLAVVGGVLWLVVIALIALTGHLLQRPPAVLPLATTGRTLLGELNAARPLKPVEGESWVVTKVTSAHHMLVVNVDADRVGNAQNIATQIVGPVRNRGFDEVLVYVWGIHRRKAYADRRVQWTPKGGYSELVMGD
jgi:hypothetical protein